MAIINFQVHVFVAAILTEEGSGPFIDIDPVRGSGVPLQYLAEPEVPTELLWGSPGLLEAST
jgi:hypothetical protein